MAGGNRVCAKSFEADRFAAFTMGHHDIYCNQAFRQLHSGGTRTRWLSTESNQIVNFDFNPDITDGCMFDPMFLRKRVSSAGLCKGHSSKQNTRCEAHRFV